MSQTLDARAIALGLLDGVLVRHRLLDDCFDTDPDVPKLEPRDRAFVRLLAAETLRHLGVVDHLIAGCLADPLPPKARTVQNVLRLGVCQLLILNVAPHAAISTAVDLVKGTALAGYAKLINAVLRRMDREGRALLAGLDAPRLNTPDWLWRSWTRAYGEDAARAIALAHQGNAPIDVWAPKDAATWAEQLGATLLPTGALRMDKGGDVTGWPGFDQGAWWVQDAAAGLPARLLGDVAGRRVLDLCAAPGGKTMQLAHAGAEVTALDLSAKRLERLSQNLGRMGLSATVVAADAAVWEPPQAFPLVLLDAPCSATGTLRRHPDGLFLKSPADVARLVLVQDRLLEAAIRLTEPGGLLVYCVCSLQKEEGETRIEKLLSEGAPVTREPISADEVGGLPELITPDGDLRTLPCHLADRGGMDAFFAARLRRI